MDLPRGLVQERALGEILPEDKFELPAIGLSNANEVLLGAISQVRKERQVARAPIVELEDVFTNEELSQLGEAWLSMDSEDTGVIRAPELITVLATLGISPSEEEYETILKSLNVERDGQVTWEMFVNLMAELRG
jgi:Ca2+-binding EF-hand superfamily protein